ncbi:MAG TPA: hypothetical protein VGL20_20995 [Candidatus Dormibacteraeota bacterium]
MQVSATVPHATSSRLRLRLEGDPDEVAGLLERVASTAAAHPGVRSVRTDLRTGSALLTWDPEQLDLPAAIELCRKAHQALRDIAPPQLVGAVERPLSEAASRLLDRVSTANRRVHDATGGKVDLRFLVPAGFAALSLRQLLRTGPAVGSMPWYALAYYAFDSFVKLHGDGEPSLPEAAA